MKAYAYASQGALVWLIAVGGSFVGILVTAKFAHATGAIEAMGAWVFVLMILISGGCFLAAWLYLNRRDKRRFESIAPVLISEGYTVEMAPSHAVAAAFYQGTSDLVNILRFKNGHHGIRWFAFHGNYPSATRIFEHEFTTGTGKHMQTHPSTVMMWPMKNRQLGDPPLAEAPMAGVSKLGWSARRAGKSIEVQDSRFDIIRKDWAVHGDVATAVRFLKPDVMDRLLNHSPKGEMWWIGGGFIAVKIGGHLDAQNLRAFLNHVGQIIGARS